MSASCGPSVDWDALDMVDDVPQPLGFHIFAAARGLMLVLLVGLRRLLLLARGTRKAKARRRNSRAQRRAMVVSV